MHAMTKCENLFIRKLLALWILIFFLSDPSICSSLNQIFSGHFGNSMWTHIFTRLIHINLYGRTERKKIVFPDSCVFLTNHIPIYTYIQCDFQLVASNFQALKLMIVCSCLYLLPLQWIFEPHKHTFTSIVRSLIEMSYYERRPWCRICTSKM